MILWNPQQEIFEKFKNKEEIFEMADVKVSIRINEEVYEILKESGNVSGRVNELLEKQLGVESREAKESARVEEIRRRVEGVVGGRIDFRLPVGEVICWSTNPQTSPWWCPEDKLTYMKELSKDWESHGFKMCVGVRGGGTWFMPEVIEETAQERRKNGRFSVSARMVGAYLGDRMIWLEITEPRKALDFMRTRTDIPMVVRADGHKYGVDKTYTAAFDTANELFIHYWVNERPKTAETDVATESDFVTLYDL